MFLWSKRGVSLTQGGEKTQFCFQIKSSKVWLVMYFSIRIKWQHPQVDAIICYNVTTLMWVNRVLQQQLIVIHESSGSDLKK